MYNGEFFLLMHIADTIVCMCIFLGKYKYQQTQ